MKTIDKIPKTIKLIKENFKNYYKEYDYECDIRIDENDNYYTELISMKSKYWYINLAQFLKNKNFKLLSVANSSGWYDNPCSNNTLIIKYWKDTNKVQVKVNSLEIRNNKNQKLIYTKGKRHLFSLTEKGCYTVINNIIYKLSINTLSKFHSSYGYANCLITELYPEVIKFNDLNYLPSKFKNFESPEAIIKHIDPRDKGKLHSINNLISLYHFLYKNDFNELLKYSNRMYKFNINNKNKSNFKDLNLKQIINLYYMKRYPSYNITNTYQIVDLFNTNKKIKLVHPKKLEKYLFNRLKNKIEKINKNSKRNLCCSINGYKRLINNLFNPSFKFTWELLDNNKKIIDAFNEVCVSVNSFKKSCYIKIYYKRNIIIFDVSNFNMYVKLPHDTITSLNRYSDYKRRIKSYIMLFINKDISEKLYKKSKGKFGHSKSSYIFMRNNKINLPF
jgi:hypothetical protein